MKNKGNEFDLNEVKVAKQLYDLSDSGDRWIHTYREHHLKGLSMTSTIGDPSAYYKLDKDELIGISGTYVDDTLQTGKYMFRQSIEEGSKQSDTTKFKDSNVTFIGMQVSQQNVILLISIESYVSSLEFVPVPCTFDKFR